MAERISERIESAAVSLQKEANAIENCRAELESIWEGDIAKNLSHKLAALTEDLTKRVGELEKIANDSQ